MTDAAYALAVWPGLTRMRSAWIMSATLGAFAFPATCQAQTAAPASAACYEIDRIGPLVELSIPGSKLTAVVAPKQGGALVGLSVKRDGMRRELLYRGMDFCPREGWGGKAPILWPATGRNFDEKAPNGLGWSWKGRPLPMPIHGFARDLPWRVVSQAGGGKEATARLELTETASTLAYYPFRFVFTITYRLKGSMLSIEHRIVASSANEGPMPFSIGNHITFRQPLLGAGTMTVTTPARKQILLDRSGKPTGVASQPSLDRFPVAALGREKALPLADYPATPWVRLDDESGLRITLSHHASRRLDGLPVMFNLWGNAEAGFFSPEPWLGRQNALVDGTGLVRLPAGKAFIWVIKIRVED
ncbi:MAG: hypothetical protein J0I80_04055 [Sphingomonas sp.]|nr:hypothetical protein [Sphingomonas sp.]